MMFRRTAIAAAAALGGSLMVAQAADLTGDELKTLILGNTLYFEFSAENSSGTPGQGFAHFAADGTIVAKLPDGKPRTGTWAIKDNATCITYKDRGPIPCSRYDKQGETITLINADTGKPRAKVVKTVPGNPEKL